MIPSDKIFKLIRENISILNDMFDNLKLKNILGNKIILIDDNNIEYKTFLENNFLVIEYNNENLYHKYTLDIQDKKFKHIMDTIIEKRKNGYLIVNNIRNYEKISKDYYLNDIMSLREIIVTDNNIPIDFILTSNNYKKQVIRIDAFQTKLNSDYGNENKMKKCDYPNITYYNNNNISKIYDFIEGNDKISRIYNLYMGKINNKNIQDIKSIKLGLLDSSTFAYEYQLGINNEIDSLIGPSNIKNNIGNKELIEKELFNIVGFRKKINSNDLDSIIEALNYKMSSVEKAKYLIDLKMGIPHEDYEKLSYDERKKLIKISKSRIDNLVNNSDYITVMIGSGENSTFKKLKKGTKYYSNGCMHIAGSNTKKETFKEKIKSLFKK